MKKIILLILFSTFIFLSCERTDIYDDATSYASIYAWFSPEKSLNDGVTIYMLEDIDGRKQFLYNASGGPTLSTSYFNGATTLTSASVRFLQNENFFLNSPMTIIIACGNISSGTILSNMSNPSSLHISCNSDILYLNTSELSVPFPASDTNYILSITIDEKNYATVYKNSTKLGSGQLTTDSRFSGLSLFYDGSAYGTADIGDIIFFDKAINDKARKYYVDLLMDKYNL